MNLLKQFLLKNNMSQPTLARKIGISNVTVNRLANRKTELPLGIRYILAALENNIKPYGDE